MSIPYYEERFNATDNNTPAPAVNSDVFADNVPVDLALVHETPMGGTVAAVGPMAETAASPILGQTLYNDGTLFHGPSFQGVERVYHVSESKLTMQVSLPQVDQKVQGQFPVQTGNPFIYDAIVQGVLIWAQVYYQAPCLPAYVEHLEQYKAIPFDQPLLVTLEIKSQSDTSVIGDLTVQDPDGGVYANITGLRCTISARLNNMIGVKQKTQDL